MRQAARAGLWGIALTDHDSTSGWAEAAAAVPETGVALIPGMELSTREGFMSVHMLAYLVDPLDEGLLAETARIRESRFTRAEEIVRRIGRDYELSWDDVLAQTAEGTTIGRPHIADALVAAGHARDRQDAFDRFLGDDGPATVPHRRLSPEEAVRLVADSGGAPALAHPASLRLAPEGLSSLLARLAAAGLRGVEVYRPDHEPERRDAYAALARRHDLVATGGSDFHRPADGLLPGDTGEPPLPLDAIDRLLAA